MIRRLPLRAALVALVAILGCVAIASATALPTYITTGPNDTRGERPGTIYLSADAGPELVAIHWTGWGTTTAVGHGIYRAGSTGGGWSARATLTLSHHYICRAGDNATYDRGTLRTVGDSAHRALVLRFPQYAPVAFCR